MNLVYSKPLSRCGHLDFTSFQLIVTKVRLDEIIVWCNAQWMLAFIAVIGNREYNQDGDSMIKVYLCPSFLSPWSPLSLIISPPPKKKKSLDSRSSCIHPNPPNTLIVSSFQTLLPSLITLHKHSLYIVDVPFLSLSYKVVFKSRF